MKIGLELEGFFCKDGKPAVVPVSVPHDDCGWLVEYRGAPHCDPFDAVASLMADRERVKPLIPKDAEVVFENHMKVDRDVKLAARRTFEKGLLKFQNLYGRRPSSLDHAGIHVSFTKPREVTYTDGGREKKVVVNQLWDYVQLFKALDKLYAAEIKVAKRVPGFYEIKDDLRIEYRSLPNTIDLWELATNLKALCARL